VYSANGLVKLLDAQSKVLGNYQGTLSQGQARIGVYWNTIETPNGVTISLDSGGTGPLGAAGVSGYVDTHFWERFGGAILLSTVDDFAAALAGKDDNNTSRFENTTSAAQQMAAEALKNTINIPPTLYKNQGDRIGILVSRTLSFENVYELEYVGE
jgi:type IV secretion system protein VirB10